MPAVWWAVIAFGLGGGHVGAADRGNVADPGLVRIVEEACLLHDAHETRIGDVPSVGRAYVTTAEPEAITAHQTAGMPDDVAKVFRSLTADYETGDALEIRLAHDADKVETLLQAIEYEQQGHDTSAWKETSLAALRTDSGRELARAIGSTDPRWWSAFAASYHELRAGSRGRARAAAAPAERSELEAE